MDITLTYSPYQLKCLPALIAACSKNVRLVESEDSSQTPSMLPGCSVLKNSHSIICLILNHNPIDKILYEDALFIEKRIKPVLYNFYKHDKKSINKVLIGDVQEVVKSIETRFTMFFTTDINNDKTINSTSLTLWSELFLLLNKSENLERLKVSETLINWFHRLLSEKSVKRALAIALIDESNEDSLKKVIGNLPHLTITEFNIVSASKSALETDFKAVLNTFLHVPTDLKPPLCVNTPKLPTKDAKNILITSALPYVNNVPHLGNLIGSTLSGDFYSRYCRIRGWNSIYICGTDEYGTATEVKASLEKCSPRDICDKYHAIHRDVYKWFGIEFDQFGRTSDEEHTKLVQKMFQDVSGNHYIGEDSVQQLLCVLCNRFLADRFVEGVCPNCGFEDARGDQCDGCGKLINATELKQPKCKLCSNEPVVKESRHLFLELDKLKDKLVEYSEKRKQTWSISAKGITKSWLSDDLKPRCITRDLKWGIQVPKEGFDKKVFYVWFDAVLGYISITSKYTDQWKQWWLPDPKNKVTLVQFMAKDNVPFHSIIFPAILQASGKPYLLPDTIAATEYLNYESMKFSKSRGVGVFGTDVMEIEHQTQIVPFGASKKQDFHLHPDFWRFYLAVSRPESQDSSFMWDDFVTRLNSELLNNLGNFVNRSFSFIMNKFGGIIPANWTDQIRPEEDGEFLENVNEELEKYCVLMDQMKFRDATATILNISRYGNTYLQKYAPWKLLKLMDTDPTAYSRAGTLVSIAANVSVLLGTMLLPIMPHYGNWIHEQCQAPMEARYLLETQPKLIGWLKAGHKLGTVQPMFVKIEQEQFVNSMRSRFG